MNEENAECQSYHKKYHDNAVKYFSQNASLLFANTLKMPFHTIIILISFDYSLHFSNKNT